MQNFLKKCVAVDIETNGLLAEVLDYSALPYKLNKDAVVWVISFTDVSTMKSTSLVREEITKENIDKVLKPYDYIITHNGLKFDLLFLKLMGLIDYKIGWLSESDMLNRREVKFIDTLLLSRLLNPDRHGGHSLEAWGKKIGEPKTNYRQKCIDAEIISARDPKGEEFRRYNEFMKPYCEQDTRVTSKVFISLLPEYTSHEGWRMPFKMESKLADLAIRREVFGFWFDKEFAIQCVEDLTKKIEDLKNKVNPLLPPRPANKSELFFYTPPKIQLLKDGEPSSHLKRFVKNIGGELIEYEDSGYYLKFEGNIFKIPYDKPIKTDLEADISNLDHVKETLIKQGWEPTEWRERDFVKDSKKQILPLNKRITAFQKWLKETVEDGKYKKHRLKIGFESFKTKTIEEFTNTILEKLKEDFPVILPTAPSIRVGASKELCPNLIKLGDKVGFAKDFAKYLTYRHRKSSIAGGDTDVLDLEDDMPKTGFLSIYRETDGRIPTPAIEVGASTGRYRHLGVCNVPRASSEYGAEIRRLFGCGDGYVQFGFDYNSLENRVQGGYVKKYPKGEELATMLLADKPNDLHTINANRLGITRDDAKTFGYATLYGASPKKLASILNVSVKKGRELYDSFWEAVTALKMLKEDLEKEWKRNGEKWIQGIDGRKILIRSPHSLLNFLFQSGGVICAKYTTVFLFEELEKKGYQIDCFEGKPDIAEMISYHDEMQIAVKRGIIKYETFDTEESAIEFKNKWSGKQLSSVKKGNNGWYIALPSIMSEVVENATKRTEQLLNLQFSLAFEYDVHKTWEGCH